MMTRWSQIPDFLARGFPVRILCSSWLIAIRLKDKDVRFFDFENLKNPPHLFIPTLQVRLNSIKVCAQQNMFNYLQVGNLC